MAGSVACPPLFLQYWREQEDKMGWRKQNRKGEPAYNQQSAPSSFSEAQWHHQETSLLAEMLYFCFQSSKTLAGKRELLIFRSYKKKNQHSAIPAFEENLHSYPLPFCHSPITTSPGSVCLLWFAYLIILTYFICSSFGRYQSYTAYSSHIVFFLLLYTVCKCICEDKMFG